MSNRKQSRKWNLTINEPIEKGWTHDKNSEKEAKKGGNAP